MDQNHTDLAQDSGASKPGADIDYAKLTQSLWYAERQFEQEKDRQGFVGQGVDFLKNNFGGKRESDSWLSRTWSNVLSADNGSHSIEQNFANTKSALDARNADAVLPALKVDGEGNTVLKARDYAADYAESQRAGVGLAADIFAMGAAGAGRNTLGSAMLRGAFAKTGIKIFDGAYANPVEDAATGALIGLSVPVAGHIKDAAARAFTAMPTALGSTAEGAILGFAQGTTTNYETFRSQNKSIVESALSAPLETVAHPAPILLGGAMGGVAGVVAKRLTALEAKVPLQAPSNEFVAMQAKAVGQVKANVEIPDLAQNPGKLTTGGTAAGKEMVTAVYQSFKVEPIRDMAASARRSQPSSIETPATFTKFDKVAEYKLSATDDLTANSNKIADLINSRNMTADELFAPVKLFPAADAPVVTAILERAAMNTADKGIMEGAASVYKALRTIPKNDRDLFTFAQTDTSGMFHAYLTRKAVGSDRSISLVDELSPRELVGRPPTVFDSPAALSDRFKSMLGDEAKRGNFAITFVDNSLFDRAPNVFDYAVGGDAVVNKLQVLNQGVKDALSQEPGLTMEQAINKAIYGDFDKGLQAFKSEMPSSLTVNVVRPGQLHSSHVLNERATAAQVEHFFQENFIVNGEERGLAASKAVLQDAKFESFGQLVKDVRDLKATIDESARVKGLDPANDQYLLGHHDGILASDGMMAYLAQKYAGVKPQQFVTKEEYLKARGKENAFLFFDAPEELAAKRLVILDDAIYSGDQIVDSLGSLRDNNIDKVVATISSTSQFARRFSEMQAPGGMASKTDLLSMHTDLDDLFSKLNISSKDYLRMFGEQIDKGYSGLTTTRVMPQMTSDTTVNWLSRFANKFLHIGGPNDGYFFDRFDTVLGTVETAR